MNQQKGARVSKTLGSLNKEFDLQFRPTRHNTNSNHVRCTMARTAGCPNSCVRRWWNREGCLKTMERSPGHYEEWVQACRGGKRPVASFDCSGPMTETVRWGSCRYEHPALDSNGMPKTRG